MANDICLVVVSGRLTRDPELKKTSSGNSLCTFSIACNESYSIDGEKRESTSFFNCIAWGGLAGIVDTYCRKGTKVHLNGRLKQNTWQGEDGRKNSSIQIVVSDLRMSRGKANNVDGSRSTQEIEPPDNFGDDEIPF